MPRVRGYSKVGKRCYGVQDWGAKGRTNVIAALVGKLLIAVTLFTCNIDSDVFYGWVNEALIPQLPDNSVVVMDNATFHKRGDMQKLITDAGHIVEYLPPCSPDLNPIEQKWAHKMAQRRKMRCSINELFSEDQNIMV